MKVNSNEVIPRLIKISNDLEKEWEDYLLNEYPNFDYEMNRLDYIDITLISRFLIRKVLEQDNYTVTKIFDEVEIILKNGSDQTKNLIVVGLLESIQNISSNLDYDYKNTFIKFLKINTKIEWERIIEEWE